AKQAAGELTGLTGVDDPYEAPTEAALVLPTQDQTPQESADAVYAVLAERGLV
ncbi:adenylyl-sulfate kinase, partial [Streptomyces blattellae]|uniref:adenylyl-sulfate kinase n=1 Tax=Streptomyces blattellae TaxID=2569855 RepID=UPI0012B8E654